MALKISEISATLSSIVNDTWIEVSEQSGSNYTTKKFNLKQLVDLISNLTTAVNNLTSRLDALAASEVSYDNTTSSISATDVQEAIDELVTIIEGL